MTTHGRCGAMNDFNECLKLSEDNKTDTFWTNVYNIAFPNMTNNMTGYKGKCQSQEYGVDRIIYLENGKTITIDEKVRRDVYPDIALEYVSNDTTQSLGWMEKDLSIDYLAYAFLPTKTVYLWDWRILKLAWNKNKDKWKKEYFISRAKNQYYTTLSVCVPIATLQQECQECSVIKL